MTGDARDNSDSGGPQSRVSAGRSRRGLFTGTAVSQLIVVGMAPVITRIFAPEAFGEAAVLWAVISLLAIVAGMRLYLPIPLLRSRRAVKALCASGAIISTAVLTVAAIVSLVAAKVLPTTSDVHHFLGFWPLVVTGAAALVAYQFLVQLAVHGGRYTDIGVSRTVYGIVAVMSQVLLGVVAARQWALVMGQVIGQVGAMLPLLRGMAQLDRIVDSGSKLTLRAVSWVTRRYRAFALFSMPAALMNTGGLVAPPILLGFTYGPAAAGYFAVAQRVLQQPMQFVGYAFTQGYMGDFGLAIRTNGDPKRVFVKVSKELFVIGVPTVLLVGLLAPIVFGTVFGEEWAEAGWVLLLIAPMVLGQFLVSPVSQTLNMLERQRIQILWDACRLIVVVISITVPYMIGFDVNTTLTIYGLSGLGAYLILWRLSFGAIKNVNESYPKTIRGERSG